MQQSSNKGNVARLAIAQALSMTTMNVNIINTALVGFLLAPVAWLATLGLSLQFVAMMLTTLPASLLMVKLGRRSVFIGGVLIASVAACLQGIAIIVDSFPLFCAGSMALGIAHGCASFYRYAATDCAAEDDKPKAISYVLAGGLMAALFGPEIARNTVDWVPGYLYAGCYFSVSMVQIIALLALAGVKIPKPVESRSGGRPLGVFAKNPVYIVGMVCAAIGFSLMTYLMTATPLQVVNVAQLGTSANATIIQWHVVAMFAPSFFTGSLIQRFGIIKILSAGLVAYIAAIVMALAGDKFTHYFTTLFLLGLGWNFLYIGGSTLVARVATAEERGRVQGAADLAITSLVAFASLTAGGLHSQFGWDVMVLSGFVPIGILACALVWFGFHQKSTSLAAP
jgi:MFS family permease